MVEPRKPQGVSQSSGRQIPIEDANPAVDESRPQGAAANQVVEPLSEEEQIGEELAEEAAASGDEVQEEPAAEQNDAVQVEAAECTTEAECVEDAQAESSVTDDGTQNGPDADVNEDASDLIEEAEAILKEAEGPESEPSAEDLLAKAQEETREWQDKYLRLHAEWDTYRRRTTEQRAADKAIAAEKLVMGLLPVIDDLERSIAYASQNGENGLLEGVEAVLSKFLDVLRKEGVEVIDPKGQPFDALEAQAVGTVPDAEAFEETVHDVYQKGFRMGKKVLRAAMVTVTTGGPIRKAEDQQAE